MRDVAAVRYLVFPCSTRQRLCFFRFVASLPVYRSHDVHPVRGVVGSLFGFAAGCFPEEGVVMMRTVYAT